MWIAIGAAALWTTVVLGGAAERAQPVRPALCQVEMNGNDFKCNRAAKQFGHHDKSSSLGGSRY